MQTLVIVESPSKAKTINKYLGPDYLVESSVGHIRDLSIKDLGIDIEKNFKPNYIIDPKKTKVIANLKKLLKKADSLLLATDPDREGEAIAWHLVDTLKPTIPYKRLVFNEITKASVQEALTKQRDVNINLVKAQESRRIVDRLFGFLVSKKLWFNIKGSLSAGRVQSPAIKIIVDKEKERTKFIKSEYWSISSNLSIKDEAFISTLVSIGGKKIAVGKDFNKNTGEPKSGLVVLNENSSKSHLKKIANETFVVKSISKKQSKQYPSPPFITSTLQREGIRKLKMSAQQVMSIAQKLYEAGHITYMRTDSVRISNDAISTIRNIIERDYKKDNLSEKPIYYKESVKNAQEAHEAIRPSGQFVSPQKLSKELDPKTLALYQLIWNRTVASQMKPAIMNQVKAVIVAGKEYIFESNGRTIHFAGYLNAYEYDKAAQSDSMLPKMNENDNLVTLSTEQKQHFTKPPSRFNEASLVKKLEDNGIGRPSTYATIMTNIQNRGYVYKLNGALVPTFTAYAVVQFLEKNFHDLVNLQYTASLEDSLDSIAEEKNESAAFLKKFYFGKNDFKGLHTLLEVEVDKNESRTIVNLGKVKEKETIIKIGRYGIYMQHGDKNYNLNDDFEPCNLNEKTILELISQKDEEPKKIAINPDTGEPVVLKNGRYGKYLQSGDKIKSIPKGIDELTEEIAEKIIKFPVVLGKSKEHNGSVILDIGRYGPYMKCGTKTKSLTVEQIFSITLDQANEELKKSNKSKSSVVKSLGKIEIKEGRYGMYISDGKTNVKFPNDMEVADMTEEKGQNLIKQKKMKK